MNKVNKAIIIGTSASGKTTLIRYLREHTTFPIKEMDAVLTKLNDGKFPIDDHLRKQILTPEIVHDVISSKNIIFFTNTDYFQIDDLKEARHNGFKVIQLYASLELLQKRNQQRAENEGYSDLGQWLEGMVSYQDEIKKLGLVDFTLDASKSIPEISTDLIKFLHEDSSS